MMVLASQRKVSGRSGLAVSGTPASSAGQRRDGSLARRFQDFVRSVSKYGFQEAAYTLTLPIPLTSPISYVIEHSIDFGASRRRPAHGDTDGIFVSNGRLEREPDSKTSYRGWLYAIGAGGELTASIRLTCREYRLREDKILQSEIALIGLSHVLHSGICQEIIDAMRLQTNAKLTPREIEALKWTADGKTASDISKILSISRRTVEYHISSAMTKLGAATRSSAVIKAHALGLLAKSGGTDKRGVSRILTFA